VDEADLLGFFERKGSSRRHQLNSPRLADQPREALRPPGAGQDAQGNLGQSDLARVPARQADVCRQSDFERSEEHTSELQSRFDLISFPTRRSSDLLTRPISSASSKEKVRPVAISSIARDLPISRERRCVPPVPGKTPRATSGSPILPASRRARRMSAAKAISRDRKSTRLNSSHVSI